MTARFCPTSGPLETAIAALRRGLPVLLAGEGPNEPITEVVISAAMAEPASTTWAVRHSTGLLSAAMQSAWADRLDIPPMMRLPDGASRTASYGVSVDARDGVTTGISAVDRAHTARVLADSASAPDDLTRPGHVLTYRADEFGVLRRPLVAEAATDLCAIAGLPPVALTASVVHDSGASMPAEAAADFAVREGIPLIHITEIAHRRLYHDHPDGRVRPHDPRCRSTDGGLCMHEFTDGLTNARHAVLLTPSVRSGPVSVFVVRECPHGLLDPNCDCQENLRAHRLRAETTGGALVYLRQAVRGGGIHPDETEYGSCVAMLEALGIEEFDLVWPDTGLELPHCVSRLYQTSHRISARIVPPTHSRSRHEAFL
ncbi:3,4-dihydroxy-2-butanone-4-phosphate synthase [Tsukamurella tyrosinosolvens]|uniref:3,4-dihydroxy-2-butanone-4-phosphate synthase n=1 Tax=Tsukamurella tyrosinosolvens TaxID=57704 RepID=UPI000C7F3394|nr:3,4-dihydroxy-2-butanone-4-phosphate synthase [Tsukamurella tyrosinosolvens]AUN41814.1 hypothetical protein ASU32_18855 [Tsukamurella tyrosinosolvens]